jgi:hypothetical protein
VRFCRSDPPGIGGAAQHDQAPIRELQVGLDRIEAHVGVDGQRIGGVALEGLPGVLLGGRPDIATLGIQHHRHRRVPSVDVGNQVLQLVLGMGCREVGDLRLECTGQIRSGIHDALAEGKDCVRAFSQMRGKSSHVGIEPDAQE